MSNNDDDIRARTMYYGDEDEGRSEDLVLNLDNSEQLMLHS